MPIAVKCSVKGDARISDGSPLMEFGRITDQASLVIDDLPVVQFDVCRQLVIFTAKILVVGIYNKRQMGQLFRRQDDERTQLGSRTAGKILCRGTVPGLTQFSNAVLIEDFFRTIRTRRSIIGALAIGTIFGRGFFLVII